MTVDEFFARQGFDEPNFEALRRDIYERAGAVDVDGTLDPVKARAAVRNFRDALVGKDS